MKELVEKLQIFWFRRQFVIVCGGFQLLFVCLFAVFAEYPLEALPGRNVTEKGFTIERHYGMFINAHTMIFIGFAYIMTFLKRYGYSSIGLNFIIASFVIQWSLIIRGFFFLENGTFTIGLPQMLLADATCALVLFGMGVMLGKLSPTQYILLSVFGTLFGVTNEYVCIHLLKAVDMGASLIVHGYGSFFGLGIAFIMHRDDVLNNPASKPVYHADMFTMLGTLVLWIFWPSFNAFLAYPADAQYRTIINTFLALNAGSVTSLFMSAALNSDGKFSMVHAQTGGLAGGVAIGTSCNLIIHPFTAILVGSLGAVINTIGYNYISPFLGSRLRMHDTCGIANVHGWPAILAGVVGALMAGLANYEVYGESLYDIFEASKPGSDRSAIVQAAIQLVAILLNVIGGFIAGLISGYFINLKIWNKVEKGSLYEDEDYWELPAESDPYREKLYKSKDFIYDKKSIWDSHDKELHELAIVFIGKLNAENVGMSIGGFFKIRKSLLLTMLSLVITYLALLLQMKPHDTNQCICHNSTLL